MPAEESVQDDSCSCYFGGRGLPDVGLSVRGRGCGALRKVRRTLAGIPLFGGVWSLSHSVADPGRSFRAVVSAVGDWVVLPSLLLFLTVGRLPPGCPGCRGRSDVGVIFACRRCPGRCPGAVVKWLEFPGGSLFCFVAFRKEFCPFRKKIVSSFRLQGNADRFLHLSQIPGRMKISPGLV